MELHCSDVSAAIKEFIADLGAGSRIGLSLPEEHLGSAAEILGALQDEDVVLLGDTWYEQCCIDQLCAQHLSCAGIVHVGVTCGLFPAVPVRVVPLRAPLPELPEDVPSGWALHYHASLSHALPELEAYATAHELRLQPVVLRWEGKEAGGDGEALFTVASECEGAVYVAPPCADDSRGLLLTLSAGERTLRVVGVSSPLLGAFWGARYQLHERVRKASHVGLLCADPSRVGARQELATLRAEALSRGQVPYSLCVGRVSEVKLLNFPLLSIMVVVGCPRTVLSIDKVSSMVSLMTPLEYLMASRSSWTPLYATGVLPQPHSSDDDDDDDEDDETAGRQIVPASEGALVASPAAALLRMPGRWIGVEHDTQHLEPQLAVAGRSGIAKGYEAEGEGRSTHSSEVKPPRAAAVKPIEQPETSDSESGEAVEALF